MNKIPSLSIRKKQNIFNYIKVLDKSFDQVYVKLEPFDQERVVKWNQHVSSVSMVPERCAVHPIPKSGCVR